MSKYMDIINDVEEHFNVDELVIDDTHIWPIIRYDIVTQLNPFFVSKRIGSTSRFMPLFRKIAVIVLSTLRQFYATIRDYRNNSRFIKSDVLYLTNTIDLVKHEDRYYNRIIDPLYTKLNNQCIKGIIVETNSIGKYRIPRNNKSIFIQRVINSIVLYRNIINGPNKYSVSTESTLVKIESYIKNKYSVPISININKIRVEFNIINDLSRYFFRILKKNEIVTAISTQYYGRSGMALNLACRRLNITSADIQHGVEHDLHWAYGRWNKIPEAGYSLLPEIFICWSNAEKKVIQQWNSKVLSFHYPMAIGNMWLEELINDLSPSSNRIKMTINSVKEKFFGFTHVLYTMQDDDIPEMLLNSIEKTRDNCIWWIRLHPSKQDAFARVNNLLLQRNLNNIILSEANELPLYNILQQMDKHITAWSTVVIEARDIGVKSILIHENGAELYKNEITEGLAVFADTDEKVIEILSEDYWDSSSANVMNHASNDFTKLIVKILSRKNDPLNQVP